MNKKTKWKERIEKIKMIAKRVEKKIILIWYVYVYIICIHLYTYSYMNVCTYIYTVDCMPTKDGQWEPRGKYGARLYNIIINHGSVMVI